MATRSGVTYNPSGNLIDMPSSSNPSNPPSDLSRLEKAFASFAEDMRAQVNEIKKDLNETRALTNRRLNELEHPDLSLHGSRRNSSVEARPSPSPGYRSTPPPSYPPPVQPEYKTPPPFEHGYPPYSSEPRPYLPTDMPRPHEYKQPLEEHPYHLHRERYFPLPPQGERRHRDFDPDDRIIKDVKIEAPTRSD